MLALSRKTGETIVIGDVTIKVLKARDGMVRLGFEAPPEISIQRGEVAAREHDIERLLKGVLQ